MNKNHIQGTNKRSKKTNILKTKQYIENKLRLYSTTISIFVFKWFVKKIDPIDVEHVPVRNKKKAPMVLKNLNSWTAHFLNTLQTIQTTRDWLSTWVVGALVLHFINERQHTGCETRSSYATRPITFKTSDFHLKCYMICCKSRSRIRS